MSICERIPIRNVISTVATRIGDPCEEDIQCEFTFTPQSECREGTCQCAHDSHFTDGRCYESVGECCFPEKRLKPAPFITHIYGKNKYPAR